LTGTGDIRRKIFTIKGSDRTKSDLITQVEDVFENGGMKNVLI